MSLCYIRFSYSGAHSFHHVFSDGDAGEGGPLIGGCGCPGEVLPCDGSALWAVRETAGHEWGSGHEDALHQLCAAEVSGLPAGTRWQPGCPAEEVTSSLRSFHLRQFCKWSHKNIYFFFCPSLLKGRDGDGFPQYQEKFIRDCIRKFPYCEATLLQQLVRSIAPVEIVSTFLNI